MHIFLSGNWPLVEAEGYFAEEVLPRAEDPLAWLKANEKRFHLLSHLAKKYLCIPGTYTCTGFMYTSTYFQRQVKLYPICEAD